MATKRATPSRRHKCDGSGIIRGTRNVRRLSRFPGLSRNLTTKEWGATNKPDEIIHPDTTKDEDRAINATIIARTVMVQTKLSDSLEASILTH